MEEDWGRIASGAPLALTPTPHLFSPDGAVFDIEFDDPRAN